MKEDRNLYAKIVNEIIKLNDFLCDAPIPRRQCSEEIVSKVLEMLGLCINKDGYIDNIK